MPMSDDIPDKTPAQIVQEGWKTLCKFKFILGDKKLKLLARALFYIESNGKEGVQVANALLRDLLSGVNFKKYDLDTLVEEAPLLYMLHELVSDFSKDMRVPEDAVPSMKLIGALLDLRAENLGAEFEERWAAQAAPSFSHTN